MDQAPSAQPAGSGVASSDPGQGAEAQGSGLYDLNQVSPELRPALEAELKKIEGNVGRKFQEAAQYRQSWAPYEELGINQVPPQDAQALMSFYQLAQDEEAFDDWLRQTAESRGVLDSGDDYEDEDDDDYWEPSRDSIEDLINQRLEPYEEERSQAVQAQEIAQIESRIRSELDALREQHGEFNEDRVCQLAFFYEGDPNAIQRAFADYQADRAEVQRQFVEQKMEQPSPAEYGGQAAALEAPVSFDDAKEAARARLRT